MPFLPLQVRSITLLFQALSPIAHIMIGVGKSGPFWHPPPLPFLHRRLTYTTLTLTSREVWRDVLNRCVSDLDPR